jgi:hypothetical protein
VLHFLLDPGLNPVLESEADPEPECITVPVTLRQKVVVPAVPAPVHNAGTLVLMMLTKLGNV